MVSMLQLVRCRPQDVAGPLVSGGLPLRPSVPPIEIVCQRGTHRFGDGSVLGSKSADPTLRNPARLPDFGSGPIVPVRQCAQVIRIEAQLVDHPDVSLR
ncbi:hypothetical protein NMK54_35350 [Nocardia otitidiscaviarum]|nr:hypothetical protein [Nocardia otitidiscaviarum]MCP9625421.1 hypothetical protein [Nocardia otitidiscaviarum]